MRGCTALLSCCKPHKHAVLAQVRQAGHGAHHEVLARGNSKLQAPSLTLLQAISAVSTAPV